MKTKDALIIAREEEVARKRDGLIYSQPLIDWIDAFGKEVMIHNRSEERQCS